MTTKPFALSPMGPKFVPVIVIAAPPPADVGPSTAAPDNSDIVSEIRERRNHVSLCRKYTKDNCRVVNKMPLELFTTLSTEFWAFHFDYKHLIRYMRHLT